MSSSRVHDGSCHCGNVKYKVRLDDTPSTDPDFFAPGTRVSKCNCTICHKLGMFHARPRDPANDFILTSPSTIEEIGKYNAFGGGNNWYFCKNCGTRVFGIGAKWVEDELDVEKWVGNEGGDGTAQKVWRTVLGDNVIAGHPVHYVSVNAVTIEGVDLIDWHDKGYIFYINNLDSANPTASMRFGKPHPGGCY